MDSWVPAWPGRGDPTDDDRPLFSTFKPISEDNTASAKPGASATPVQPQGTEQLLGHHDTRSRAAAGARCGEQSILGAHPCPRPLSPSLQVPPGSSLSPPGWSPADGDLQPELAALRARTRLWFEQTQARRLGAEGELPAWFHGFISRREAEQLLQDQPPGCFLVRFSESTVGFVLSYRGRDRCRHFVLDQLPDGRYVILGERSAHAELADLLRHYAAAPITPYHEFLTVPRGRENKPRGGTWTPSDGDAARPPWSEALANPPMYSTVFKGPPRARQAAPQLPVEPRAEGGSSREAPSVPPPLPVKTSSSATAQGPPHSPAGAGAAPKGPYAQVQKEASPPEPPERPDTKYQQLMCFHTYAEPREGLAPGPPTYNELEEPIPFYAMGRGSSSSASPEENIYSEVALARQDPPAPLPRGAPGAFSTLLPKPRAHRRLFRSLSSQASKRRQLLAAPSAEGKGRGGSGPAAEPQVRCSGAQSQGNISGRVRRVGVHSTPGAQGGHGGPLPSAPRRSDDPQSGSNVEGWEGEGPTLNSILANFHPPRQELGAAPLHPSLRIPQGPRNPPPAFDEPIYGRTSAAKRVAAGQEAPENIYEQLSGDQL
ncbi:SH2 domain-containing protein 2A isoform X1 [Strix uralensis]|uniref:SH2 domain-containing protein 2A isoform X1 n=1 Tax=Strix uralensis TaxID=36305 RepID=UPI003DA6ECE9